MPRAVYYSTAILLIFSFAATATAAPCPTCGGAGGKWVVSSGFKTQRIWITCPTCGGRRSVPDAAPQQASGPSQADIAAPQQAAEEAARQAAAERQRQEAARKAAEQAAFDAGKQRALANLKGISSGDSLQLKSLGSDSSLGLKGLGDSSAVTDSMVVDARNVPTGLPKSVADSIPNTPAGNRVRKGFQAISSSDWRQHDWKVALAWFQDALNHDPGNPGIKELVDMAQYTLNKRLKEHNLPYEHNSVPVQPAPPAAMPPNDNQISPTLKAEMDEAFQQFVIKPELDAMDKAGDERLLDDTVLKSGRPQKYEDPAWAKFTKWLNDNFGRKIKKGPAPGAVRG
jgi:hypothetical protein